MSHLLLPVATFLAAAALLTITPGVDTAMVLRAATTSGPRSGAAAAAGIGLGCLVWGAGAAFGLTALLATSRLAFTVVTWAGAAYLFWLGLKLLSHPRRASALSDMPPGMRGIATGEAFRRGLLTNLLNPKVGVFYITFLPQFIPHGVNVAAFSLMLAALHVLLGMIWFSLLIALTIPLGRFLQRPKVVRTMDRLTGGVFVAFGLKLALMEHN